MAEWEIAVREASKLDEKQRGTPHPGTRSGQEAVPAVRGKQR
ncbi:MAG TPA: hypothetical protein VN203_25795 [Candidatus Acidoferrum sp.]|nr:hypothetical protein [Candidatus Acidoferrum sp.]